MASFNWQVKLQTRQLYETFWNSKLTRCSLYTKIDILNLYTASAPRTFRCIHVHMNAVWTTHTEIYVTYLLTRQSMQHKRAPIFHSASVNKLKTATSGQYNWPIIKFNADSLKQFLDCTIQTLFDIEYKNTHHWKHSILRARHKHSISFCTQTFLGDRILQ
jgi:hypothetical protein